MRNTRVDPITFVLPSVGLLPFTVAALLGEGSTRYINDLLGLVHTNPTISYLVTILQSKSKVN